MSTTPQRFSSPRNSGSPKTPNPVTPNRAQSIFTTPGPLENNNSPTSTLSDTSGIPNNRFKLDTPRDGIFNINSGFSSTADGTARRVVIRSDPSMLTCFDPADKELYDMWAPRR